MNRNIVNFGALILVVTAAVGVANVSARAGLTIVVSADTEGHVNPCNQCLHGNGLGGLGRRATAIHGLRASGGDVLVLDAGNALFGADSIDSGGAVIVEAYNAIGYAAVNLTPRDFRLGKATTLQTLRRAKFAAVSANLLDEETGQPLFQPFVLTQSGGTRVAVIGVSEPPAGLAYLPHLSKQLAGVRTRPVDEALAEWLPKAKAEADQVVLLYYGSAKGLKAVRSRFGESLAAVCAGGVRSEDFVPGQDVPLITTSEHGKRLARAVVGGDGRTEVEQIALDDSVASDPAMTGVLAAALSAGAEPGTGPGGASASVPAVSTSDASDAIAPTSAGDCPPSTDAAIAPAAETAGPRPLVRVEVEPLAPAPGGEVAVEPTAGAAAAEPAPASQNRAADAASSAPEAAQRPAKSATAPPPSVNAAPGPGETGTGAPAATPDTDRSVAPNGRPARPQPVKAARFCTNCGKKLLPSAKFCTSCGTRVAPPAKEAQGVRPAR